MASRTRLFFGVLALAVMAGACDERNPNSPSPSDPPPTAEEVVQRTSITVSQPNGSVLTNGSEITLRVSDHGSFGSFEGAHFMALALIRDDGLDQRVGCFSGTTSPGVSGSGGFSTIVLYRNGFWAPGHTFRGVLIFWMGPREAFHQHRCWNLFDLPSGRVNWDNVQVQKEIGRWTTE